MESSTGPKYKGTTVGTKNSWRVGQSVAPKFDGRDWLSSSESQTANCQKVQRKSHSTIGHVLRYCPWTETRWTRRNFDLTGSGLFLHSYENTHENRAGKIVSNKKAYIKKG